MTDEMVSLGAQLKQKTLQKRESLNNYLDLKGKTLLSNLLLPGILLCLVSTLQEKNGFAYLLIIMPYSPGSIRVFCRMRPFNHEESYSSKTLFTLDESNVFLKVAETKTKQYKFDKVFDPYSTQGISSDF